MFRGAVGIPGGGIQPCGYFGGELLNSSAAGFPVTASASTSATYSNGGTSSGTSSGNASASASLGPTNVLVNGQNLAGWVEDPDPYGAYQGNYNSTPSCGYDCATSGFTLGPGSITGTGVFTGGIYGWATPVGVPVDMQVGLTANVIGNYVVDPEATLVSVSYFTSDGQPVTDFTLTTSKGYFDSSVVSNK
jgi:hypothetical protein